MNYNYISIKFTLSLRYVIIIIIIEIAQENDLFSIEIILNWLGQCTNFLQFHDWKKKFITYFKDFKNAKKVGMKLLEFRIFKSIITKKMLGVLWWMRQKWGEPIKNDKEEILKISAA